MESIAAGLSSAAQALRTTLGRNAVKQETMAVQQRISRLDAELAQVREAQRGLEDPRAAVDQLQRSMQTDWAHIEVLKATTRELQEMTQNRETALAELAPATAPQARCDAAHKRRDALRLNHLQCRRGTAGGCALAGAPRLLSSRSPRI